MRWGVLWVIPMMLGNLMVFLAALTSPTAMKNVGFGPMILWWAAGFYGTARFFAWVERLDR